MKKIYLFLTLMFFSLGVGNAWGAEKITDYSKIVTGKTYYIGATTGGTDYYLSVSGASTSTSIAGTAKTDKANATAFVFTGSGTSWTIKFADYANYLGLKSSKDNGKVQVVSSAATFTASNQSEKLRLSIGSYSIQKNNSGTQFGSYGNTQTDIWLEEVPGSSEPTTQYTIKWHTAKGVTTDVVLNEGTAITKLATDPTMTGYEFMGWTASCDVASDGSDFTALTDFGTADSDKDFYAVFAVATTTGGGESTPTEVTDLLDRELTGATSTSYVTWSDKTATSSAVYAGQSAGGNESIQLRTTNSNSGIVSTTSGGKATKISVEWNSNTSSGRTIDIYGKNSAYTQATDLYNSTNQGTKLGSIKYGTSTELAISGDYEYIGIRSNSGALYLTSVSITWASEGTGGGTTTYSDYITTCASGIEYVELGDDFKWSATEAEVTIDATDNVFPTLTNTHNVPVTYSSSDDTFASIAADGTVTLKKEGTVTITAKYEGGVSAGTDKEYKAKTVDYTLTVKPAPLEPIAGGVIDILDNAWTELTNSDYKTVDAKTAANTGHSNAQYTAQCAGGNSSIQLRSNNSNSGIVSTVSGGLVKRVEIEWNDATSADRTLNIYGSNTPYTNPTDLYDTNKDGDKLGTIVKGTSTHLEISEDYRYIGLRSASGAMYLTNVTITWLPINSKVTIDGAIQNGSVSVSGATDLNAVAAGTELALSNTPATNYKLAAYDVYKTDNATTKVTVTDGKFIMPEFDVTISATFEQVKTLTGIEITTPATQTTFWQGETFNSTDLKVTAHFDGAADEDVTDKVTVTGSTATAGTQTVSVSYKEGATTETATYNITVKAIPNTKETAYTVADAFDIIDKLTTANGVFIKGIVSQVDEYLSNYKSITYWISDDGTTNKQLQAYSGKGLESADFTDINGISVDDQVIICGDLKKHTDGTYEFNYNNYLVEHTKTTKADPELSYTTTEYNVNLGDAFTAPTLNNPNTLAVTYSSNNEDVATVAADGAVTIKAAGTVTITASFAGNDDYVTGSASYTINITDPNVSSVTFDATIDKTADAETLSLTKDVITMTFTSGAMNNGENYRCYSGQKMTISYADGNITKIVIECTTNNDAKYGPGCFETETASYSYSGKVGTWTGEAKSITFNAKDQVRMTTVTVYYKQDKRQEAGLVWTPATISLTVGDAFTAPTLSNPNSVTGIEFTSSNSELATVNNAGAISLVSGKTGTATITATFAGDENYKAAEVTCVITVSPKSEKVVILAEREGQWYALKAEYLSGKTDRLVAIPVDYFNGTLYNIAEEIKATIEWNSIVEGDKVSFLNDGKYLKGESSTKLLFEAGEDGLYQWDNTTYTMTIGTSVRSFLYNGEAFRNFAISNAGQTKDDITYSSLPVVTAPVYKTGTLYTIKATAENGTVIGAGIYEAGAEVTLTADPAMDYTFVNWTKGGEVVSTANPFIFEATENLDLVANFQEIAATTYSLSGQFSTGEYEYAEFATGNLQHNPKSGDWRFAKQQYQYVGEANINVGDENYEGWIDMFGWSGDGKFGVNPSNKNEDYYDAFVDWGTKMGEGWSTLSADQWKYLLNTRPNAKDLKQIARVGSVVGIMLFPDVWNAPLTVTAQRDNYFEVDIHNYTLKQWADLEAAGAVFLPAAGRRTGGYGNMINKNQVEETDPANLNGGHYKHQDNTNIYCYYWTSTINESTKDVSFLHNIQALGGDDYTIGTGAVWGEQGRYGQSVRLAKVNTLIQLGDEDNSDVIEANEGKTVNVQVNRSFTANVGYYTICLPFDLAAEKIGTALQISSVTENVAEQGMNVVFTEVTNLVAGQPYLVLPSEDLTNPIFENVEIVNTTGETTATVTGAGINITFTGIINGVGEQTNGTTEYYVGDNGYLYNGTVDKLGLRAFFTITDEAGNPTKVRARVVTREDATTGFENITNGENTTIKVIENGQLIIIRNGEKFNAQGQKL